MYRASLFTAQVLARELIDTGREEKLEEIRRHVSQIAPEMPETPGAPGRSNTESLPARERREVDIWPG